MAVRIRGRELSAARSLAVAALLALMLAVWRGAAILPAGDTPPPTSPLEERVTRIVTALAGPEAVRVAATQDPAGTRQVLILLDTTQAPAPLDAAALGELLAAAGLIDPDAGDRLSVREAAFAPPAIARPALMEVAEVGALLILSAWLGWLALSSRPAERPERDDRTLEIPRQPEAPRPGPQLGAALQAAQRDPVRTARVVRAWLASERAC